MLYMTRMFIKKEKKCFQSTVGYFLCFFSLDLQHAGPEASESPSLNCHKTSWVFFFILICILMFFFPPILLIFFLTCKIIPALHQAQSLSLPWKPPLFTAGALQSLPNGCFAQPCSHTGWRCGVCCFQTQAVLCVSGCSWPPQPPPTRDMPRVLLSPHCQLAIGATSAPAEDHCSKAVLSSKTRS